jgi:hypothetical protein
MTLWEIPARDLSAGLVAAAMVARDGRYSVRVVLPHSHATLLEAAEAAEHAGVDFAVQQTRDCATVHFVARHQDRRVAPGSLQGPLQPLVRANSWRSEAARAIPAAVDLMAFRRASEALALSEGQDPEAELIWRRLLRACVRAHECGGMPTLMLNDVDGLVGLLRRRAQNRGVALRINSDACACC